MEESKELQGFYKIFRAVIYISVLMEFFEYAIDLAMLDHWGGILIDIHGRIKRWMIYNDGNLVYSKIATFLLICIIRFYAVKYHISLPKLKSEEKTE